MDIATFVGRSTTVQARLLTLMQQVRRVDADTARPSDLESVVLSVSQGATKDAGALILKSTDGWQTTFRGTPRHILAHDVREDEDACPITDIFGDHAEGLLRTLWPTLPPGHALLVAPDQAVLAGPDGVWLAEASSTPPLNGGYSLQQAYGRVPVPPGHMAVSGSRHARMAFLDSPLGRRLSADWPMCDQLLPHLGKDDFTLMFQGGSQSVLCAAGQHVDILASWRPDA